MHLANITLLQEMGEAMLPSGEERFVVVGSVGRAAVLGRTLADLHDGNRFRDIDAIDRLGILTGKYALASGAALDCGLADTIHPLSGSSVLWGAFDTLTRNSDEPIVTFHARALGLHKIQTADQPPIALLTPDACGHLGMAAMCTLGVGPLAKHHKQFRELAARRGELCSGCQADELEAAATEYCAKLSERLKRHPLSPYARLRRQIFTHAPWAARHIVDGRVGALIRNIRHTQPRTVSQLSFASLSQDIRDNAAA
jgi:hypothetical protein